LILHSRRAALDFVRHERPLLPGEQCDDVIPLKPATYRLVSVS
jgi:hypothetical protein